MHPLIELDLIPFCTSQITTMGYLDALNGPLPGHDDLVDFLMRQEPRGIVGDDLHAMKRCYIAWTTNQQEFDVGESGKVYRLFYYASVMLNRQAKFNLSGTLRDRPITIDPEKLRGSIEELLQLDGGTSQYATTAYLMAEEDIDISHILNPPPHLLRAIEAKKHWKSQRQKGRPWKPRYDDTFLRQAIAYLDLINHGFFSFEVKTGEDYCYARAFNKITPERGKELFPQVKGHETNRFKEMEKCLQQYENNQPIDSPDHRPNMALAMKAVADADGAPVNIIHNDNTIIEIGKRRIIFTNPKTVNKKNPPFWKFLEYSLKPRTERQYPSPQESP